MSLTVSTNDSKGYAVSEVNNPGCSNSGLAVASSGCAATIPTADFTVSGNAPSGFVSANDGNSVITDTSGTVSAASGDKLTDQYELTIPGGTLPGVYASTIQYTVTGN